MITSSRHYLHGNSVVDKGIVVMVIISDISNIDINEINRYSIGLSWTSVLWRNICINLYLCGIATTGPVSHSTISYFILKKPSYVTACNSIIIIPAATIKLYIQFWWLPVE